MQRRVLPFLVLGLVLCLPALASATVFVTAESHVFTQGDIATLNLTISDDAAPGDGLGINSADIDIVMNGYVPGGPMATAANFTLAPTLWTAHAITDVGDGGFSPPSDVELFRSYGFSSGSDVVALTASPQILATVTFDTTGIAPGVYTWTAGDFDNASIGTSLGGGTTGDINAVAQYVTGTLTVNVPEPASIVMALFAAAGLAAVVIRRRRRAA